LNKSLEAWQQLGCQDPKGSEPSSLRVWDVPHPYVDAQRQHLFCGEPSVQLVQVRLQDELKAKPQVLAAGTGSLHR
jgi:hypothetical protein